MRRKNDPLSPSRRLLSDDDLRLWRRVAETAEPLRRHERARAIAHDHRTDPVADDPAARAPKPKPLIGTPGMASARATTAERPAPPPIPLAAREARLIAGGRQAIDDRLDLHGMRQRDAHRLLRSFLVRAQARGHRTVLIITGKGGGEPEGPFWDPAERGVLKRAVPRWLGEREFRALVVGFATAHHRHGGEGALYVRLRRPR